jgi:hypothetical protein
LQIFVSPSSEISGSAIKASIEPHFLSPSSSSSY